MGRPPRDFSKEQVGQLKPLYIDDTKPRGSGKNIYWICQCSCGNIISVNTSALAESIRNKRNTSCGKCHAQRQDLTGNVYGKLKVIGPDEMYDSTKENNWKTKWLCQCECGNTISVFGNNLTRLHTTSCGCASRSIGEENIAKLLEENNVSYSCEYTFADLVSKKKLRFDFAIFKDDKLSHLIEFDGRQHNNNYTPWNSDETLEERQSRDKMKDDYCLKNNIKLIRIPYEKRDNITLHDLGVEI